MDLDEYIRRTVDAAPPLTSEQRDRLAVLLRDRPVEWRTPAAPPIDPVGGDVLAEMMGGRE
jgi:hypothetical protein